MSKQPPIVEDPRARTFERERIVRFQEERFDPSLLGADPSVPLDAIPPRSGRRGIAHIGVPKVLDEMRKSIS